MCITACIVLILSPSLSISTAYAPWFESMQCVNYNAVAATYVDGEPCIAVAGFGEGAGVYLQHAVTLGEVRSLAYKENVYCVCINAAGTKL